MYIVELRSNAWEGPLYIDKGTTPQEPRHNIIAGVLTADKDDAYRFTERRAALVEAHETIKDEGVRKLAGLSEVCWQVVQVD